MNDIALLRNLYEAQRKQAERNFAKDHSFEEWLEHAMIELRRRDVN